MITSTAPTNLKCESLTAPIGIGSATPRLSWVVNGPGRGVAQTAYRIQVAADGIKLSQDTPDLWDTGKVDSTRQVAIPYEGIALQKRSKVWWKVKTWDQHGRESDWSEAASFETAFFTEADWTAGWFATEEYQAVFTRKEFLVNPNKPILSARVYIAATGEGALGNKYELRLNGRKVGEDAMSPAPTYPDKALYKTYDVAECIQPGWNTAGIVYCTKVSMELAIEYADGTTLELRTDESWRQTEKGPYLELKYPYLHVHPDYENRSHYGHGRGETYDARLELGDWSLPGYQDSTWTAATTSSAPTYIKPQYDTVKVIETLLPAAITQPQPNTYVVDFGQNVHGNVVLTFEGGQAGTKVVLTFAEVLDTSGNIFPDSVITAHRAPDRQLAYHRDIYILKGTGEETYRPKFSDHVFQYVEVKGYPGDLGASRITAEVIHSDILKATSFTCSDATLTQLHEMAFWTFRDNIIGAPLDCPGKERRAWLGDAFMVSEAECINFDMARVYWDWFHTIQTAQAEDGALPWYAPVGDIVRMDVGWPSAVVLIPWDYYMYSGDLPFLAAYYKLMRNWVGFLHANQNEEYLILDMSRLNDWLGCDRPTGDYAATAFYYHCVNLLSKMAGELGQSADEETYSRLGENIKKSLQDHYLQKEVFFDNNTQTANAIALHFGFAPEASKKAVTESLVQEIRRHGGRTVGSIGNNSLFAALGENDRNDIAYQLLTNKEHWASWPRFIVNGRNTAPEHFDNKPMNSVCHPFLVGSVDAWLFKEVAGIKVVKPGFESFAIKPAVIRTELTSAAAQMETPKGIIASEWSLVGSQFSLNVKVPANAYALVYIPSLDKEEIKEGGHPIEHAAGVSYLRVEGTYAVYAVGSGEYNFTSTFEIPKDESSGTPECLLIDEFFMEGEGEHIRGSAFPPQAQLVYAEAEIRTDQVNKALEMALCQGDVRVGLVSIEPEEGGLTLTYSSAAGKEYLYYIHSSVKRKSGVEPGRFYKLKLLIDPALRCYNIYLDDRLYAKDIAFIADATHVDTLQFRAAGSGAGVFQVRNVRIAPIAGN